MLNTPSALLRITAIFSPGLTQKYSGTLAGNSNDPAPVEAVGFAPNAIQQSAVEHKRICSVLFVGNGVLSDALYRPGSLFWNAALCADEDVTDITCVENGRAACTARP